jgi:hypothetical protein
LVSRLARCLRADSLSAPPMLVASGPDHILHVQFLTRSSIK